MPCWWSQYRDLPFPGECLLLNLQHTYSKCMYLQCISLNQLYTVKTTKKKYTVGNSHFEILKNMSRFDMFVTVALQLWYYCGGVHYTIHSWYRYGMILMTDLINLLMKFWCECSTMGFRQSPKAEYLVWILYCHILSELIWVISDIFMAHHVIS